MEKVRRFRKGIERIELECGGHEDSAVVPVYMKCEAIGKMMIDELIRRKVLTIGIAYPVVEIGHARARIIIQRGHTNEQIDYAIETVRQLAEEYGYYDYLAELKKGNDPFNTLVYTFGIKNWLKSWFIPIDVFGRSTE